MQTLHEQGILESNMQPSTKPSLSNPTMFEKGEARNFAPVCVLAKATAPLVELKTTIRSSFTPFVEDSFFSWGRATLVFRELHASVGGFKGHSDGTALGWDECERATCLH